MIEFWILYFRLINAISKLYTKLLERKSNINPQSEVLVSDGAYEALFCAIMGNVNPGDEVIIIEPYFDCYEPMVRLAGKNLFTLESPQLSATRDLQGVALVIRHFSQKKKLNFWTNAPFCRFYNIIVKT